MQSTDLRQEANRLFRLAHECSDPRVRTELEGMANAYLAQARGGGHRAAYLPSVGRFAVWFGVLGFVTVGGMLALADWYKPQAREIVVTVRPHAGTSVPRGGGSSGDQRMESAENNHLAAMLAQRPFSR